MKVIIVAGGLGTRLGKYTENLPKGLLDLLGKSLIQRQIDIFRRLGLNDIIIVRKHLASMINFPGVRYHDEDPTQEGNMVRGFFHARSEFEEDIIMSYGDIIFDEEVVRKVINTKCDVGVVVDVDWKDYWKMRVGSINNDSESMILNRDDIVSLGVPNPLESDMHGRYIGLIKFSKKKLDKIQKIYDSNKKKFWDKDEKWYTSKNFKKAFTTDFIQCLIDNKIKVKAIKIKRGWLEFDTVDDYEKILNMAKDGTLSEFIKLD